MPSTGTGRNKSGTGLKILWIPGRKKHHDKGAFKPTNYKIEHRHGERKNEPWTLGGSKAHDDIIDSHEKEDNLDFIKPTTHSTVVLPSASLGVATVNSDSCSESEPEIKLEKCKIRDIQYIKYNIRDSLQSLTSAKDQCSTHSTSGDGDEKRSAGRHTTKTDYDSIDRFDDLDGQLKLQHHNGTTSISKCKKTKEDKTVKCLYYTMMCCECTIS